MAESETGAPVESLTDSLKALASPRRLEIVRLLEEPHYVEEIASKLGVARQTAQEHLDKLVDVGVVERTRGRRSHGPVTDYVVVPQRLFAIVEDLRSLGGLDPGPADPELRRRTEPLEDEAGPPGDRDVPRLVVVHGLKIGHTVPLSGEGPWLVGRDPDAPVCLDFDPFVSSKHAEVRRDGTDFAVQDLYSSNGTSVRWEELPRGGDAELGNGDVLQIGKTLLLFRTPS